MERERGSPVYLFFRELGIRSPLCPWTSLELFLCVAGNQNYSQSQEHGEVSRALGAGPGARHSQQTGGQMLHCGGRGLAPCPAPLQPGGHC